jgi:hypothetical protein
MVEESMQEALKKNTPILSPADDESNSSPHESSLYGHRLHSKKRSLYGNSHHRSRRGKKINNNSSSNNRAEGSDP